MSDDNLHVTHELTANAEYLDQMDVDVDADLNFNLTINLHMPDGASETKSVFGSVGSGRSHSPDAGPHRSRSSLNLFVSFPSPSPCPSPTNQLTNAPAIRPLSPLANSPIPFHSPPTPLTPVGDGIDVFSPPQYDRRIKHARGTSLLNVTNLRNA